MTPSKQAVYLCEFPTFLGGERSLLTFLANSPQTAAAVVAPDGGLLAKRLSDLSIRRLDWPEGGRSQARQLAPTLTQTGMDLVHANSLVTAPAAACLREECGIPAIAHVRDIMNLSDRKWQSLATLDAVIAVSHAVGDWLRQRLPTDRVHTIYNAVDFEQLRARAGQGNFRQELGLNANEILVTCIGQIALRKGQDLFLDACQLLAAADDRFRFAIIGERYSQKPESIAFEHRLHETASASPLAGRTFLMGYRDDAPSILAATDVLVIPSRQEPLSRVLLEGLSLGVPAVATDVGGSREILDGGVFGKLAAVDPHSLAQSVLELVNSPTLRRQLATAGPERIADQFSLTSHSRRILQLYDEVCARGIEG